MAATTNDAVTSEATMLWAYCHKAQGLKMYAQKLSRCNTPSSPRR